MVCVVCGTCLCGTKTRRRCPALPGASQVRRDPLPDVNSAPRLLGVQGPVGHGVRHQWPPPASPCPPPSPGHLTFLYVESLPQTGSCLRREPLQTSRKRGVFCVSAVFLQKIMPSQLQFWPGTVYLLPCPVITVEGRSSFQNSRRPERGLSCCPCFPLGNIFANMHHPLSFYILS